MKNLILAMSLLACFASVDSKAEESLFDDYKVSIGLPAYTHHLIRENEHGQTWNEDNKGLFLEVGKKDSDWALLVGSYNNSYFVRTNMLGASYRPISLFSDRIEMGVVGGLVTGYNKPVMLAASVKVKLTDNIGAHVMGVPTVGKNSGVVSAQLTLDF